MGLSTPLATYSDAGLTSANTNPVVSDGTTGTFGLIYLKAARYWRSVTTAQGVSLSGYNIGPIDPAPGFVTSLTAPSPTYPFLVWYDTTTGHKKTRSADNLSWIDNGLIDSLINAAAVSDVLTGTSTSLAVTPDALAALWEVGTAVSISANNISLPSTGGGVFTCGSASTTLTTISSTTAGRIVRIIFTNSQTITHGSGINVLGSLTTKIPAGCEVTFRRGSSDWTITAWTTGPDQSRAGAANVAVTTASNTTIGVTADVAHCESTAGLSYRHASVSVTINMASTGANGIDTGSQSTAFYAIWLISDGTTIAGLASTSFTAPTMPSGYTYKVRVGAIHSTSAVFDAIKGLGNRYHYTAGAQAVTSTNSQSNASTSLSSLVPSTARAAIIAGNCVSNAGSGAAASPNNSYGTGFTGGATPPYLHCQAVLSGSYGTMLGDVPLETAQTIFVTTGTGGTNRVLCLGWVDSAPVT